MSGTFIEEPDGTYITITEALRIIRLSHPRYANGNLYQATQRFDRSGQPVLLSKAWTPPTGGAPRRIIEYESFKAFISRKGFGARSDRKPRKRRRRPGK